jgi:hypothetical protein
MTVNHPPPVAREQPLRACPRARCRRLGHCLRTSATCLRSHEAAADLRLRLALRFEALAEARGNGGPGACPDDLALDRRLARLKAALERREGAEMAQDP